MLATEAVLSSTRQAELDSTLRALQDDNTLWVLPGLHVVGLALVVTVARHEIVCSVLALHLVIGVVWWLRQKNHLAAAWALVLGCLAVDMLVVAWAGIGPALALLALPVGLAAVSIGVGAGAATAVLCTALLALAPPTLLPPDTALRVATLMEVWGTVGLIWLASRPSKTAFEWSWSSYEQNRDLLEQARNYQVQLKEALVDLATANLQLTRLNDLQEGLRREAEEARRAKEQFVANVSHELRTPLNMIVGFTEMIMRAPKTYGKIPPALLADLAIILRNSQHLSSLIDDVLDLSQIEARRMALTKERASLAEIVESAVTAVRPLFASKGLSLETDMPPDLFAFVDRTRLCEVVLNLLSNAGRFTAAGGVRVKAWLEGPDAVVSVADTGPGISAEDRDRIFQPFEQLDGSIRRRHDGSGLGLAISKSFIELHGGSMWLESDLGVGTTFFFRVPVELPDPVHGGAHRWLHPEWEFKERTRPWMLPWLPVRPRFLIVEHGEVLERLVARHLGDVETARMETIEEALVELARAPAEALLVADAAVGERLRALNRSGALPEGMPVIVCSLPTVSAALGPPGITDYLVKPVSLDRLQAALERLPLRGGTVLLVDDEPEALRLFQRMLAGAKRRYRVLQAEDGQEALDVLREHRPDVVLLDLVMPRMGGFELLAAMKADPALRDIPVIVISARDPSGQPIVSDAVGITRAGGLSVAQLLSCIGALSEILGAGRADGPAPPGMPSGSPAFG
ncbi:MAG: response regulator [Chloroflexi bacterium]|nr:response regulator [Chloroflexota bacterium]